MEAKQPTRKELLRLRSEERALRSELKRAEELYESAFTGFQKRILDMNRVGNILQLVKLVRASKELKTAEAYFTLKEAVNIYREAFSRGTRLLDDRPLENIIEIARILSRRPTLLRTLTIQLRSIKASNEMILRELRRLQAGESPLR